MTKINTPTEDRDIQLAVISERTKTIQEKVVNIETKLEKDYVTQDQFAPIRSIVYGLVSVILLTVVGALLALVILRR